MGFDFGANWDAYSRRALTARHVEQARRDFATLLGGVDLAGRRFLDVGFGQGLSLLLAADAGARVVGCEIDPRCTEVLRRTASYFPEVSVDAIPIVLGSILDGATRDDLLAAGDGGCYDIVHAWGSLHHTGDLDRALRVAADLVAPGGHLVVAIYNRHWTSPTWQRIKRLYGRLPAALRPLMIGLFYPLIWTAKLVVTRRRPTRQQRGMDFYHDVVDWVGGDPYEFATPAELRSLLASLGFHCLDCRLPRVPTGCNELVFRRSAEADDLATGG